MQMKLQLEGGIYGHLIGNALGYRCSSKKTLNRIIISQQLARSYSNAGAMSLCTMSSIIDCEHVDIEDIANRFYEWYIGSYMASKNQSEENITISQAIRHYGNGMPADRCGSKENSDNSALVRMLPIALWNVNESLNTIVNDAHNITKFTNQNLDAQVCSALYCLIVKTFLTGQKQKTSEQLTEFYKKMKMIDHLKTLEKIQEHRNQIIHGTNQLIDSFWSSIKIFANYGNQFEESIIQAIMLGNDCGGTACIVGSLTGVKNGINDIPQRWIKQLDLSNEANKVIREFVRMILKKI